MIELGKVGKITDEQKFLDILIAKRHCFDSIVLVFLFRWHTAERYLAM